MSLLFDALKRAQNSDAPTATSDARQAEAQAIIAAIKRPRSKVLPYAAGALALLTGGFSWFMYTQNQNAVPPAEPINIPLKLTAYEPAPVSAPPGMSDTLSEKAVNKSWTHPAAKHRKKHPSAKKSAQPALPPAADPLKEGYLALTQGNLDLAEQKYLAALAKHPHEKDALLGLAVVSQRKRQTDRAARLYRQVLREDMGNAAAAAGLVSLSELADPLAAESQLRELLDIKPAAPELHYALGGVLARQQRLGEAQQSFFRAHGLAPDNALYTYNLAVSLDRLHQPADALSYYKLALKLSDPDDPTLNPKAISQRIEELSTRP
ncbi:MAG: tetratricopeptide repeat protein [Gallionella sp.]|nr:tetratricopeptide repeat protein [Gallionella sp.]